MRIRIHKTEERKAPELSQNAGSQKITHPAGAGPENCSLRLALFKMQQENRKEKKIPTVPVL